MRRSRITFLLLLCTACAGEPRSAPPITPLVLASTTSTEDSGLFDVLLPAFSEAHPELDVRLVAVGTGQALELGKRHDADVLLVHAPAAESTFVAQGFGLYRCPVMYNDFIIAGPDSDPARIRGNTDATAAFRTIAAARSPFVSRGDDSGTHKKELALWTAAGVEPGGAWYLEAGQGMAEVLAIASEKSAYTLTDRATYLFTRERVSLAVLVEGDPGLFNQYGVIPVAGAKNPEGAGAFADWVTSADAQSLIARYGVERFGQRLFTPNAGEHATRDSSTARGVPPTRRAPLCSASGNAR